MDEKNLNALRAIGYGSVFIICFFLSGIQDWFYGDGIIARVLYCALFSFLGGGILNVAFSVTFSEEKGEDKKSPLVMVIIFFTVLIILLTAVGVIPAIFFIE
jgi:hypothetical protein